MKNSGVDIIIVGAGPVGLWTASQIKLLNPNINIMVLEKHETYQRNHFAFVEPTSLDNMTNHPLLNELKNHLISDKKIKTNELEEILFELCEELDVGRISNYKVEDAKEIEAEIPGVKLIIGADGSHSTTRKTVCTGLLESEHLKYSNHFHTLMEVKYEAVGEVKPMNMISMGYPLMKHIGKVVNEVIGKKNENGNTPVTLQFFMSQEIGEQIKDATFRNPIMFHSRKDTLPFEIREPIEVWLASRFQYCEEKHIENTVKITTTTLGSYASRYYVRNIGTKATYCLVGDAAFGMPFFRSLNNGILCGTELARCVVSHFEGKDYRPPFSFEDAFNSVFDSTKQIFGVSDMVPYEGKVSQPLVSYALFVKKLEGKQLNLAIAKSSGLKAFQTWTKISAVVPWQVNKLRKEQLNDVYRAVEIFSSKDERVMYDEVVEDDFVLL